VIDDMEEYIGLSFVEFHLLAMGQSPTSNLDDQSYHEISYHIIKVLSLSRFASNLLFN
jgi:hypothetical protein